MGALALAGCSSGHNHTTTLSLKKVRVTGKLVLYSSLPMHGAGIDLANGIEYGLLQADLRAGPFKIKYNALNDGSKSGRWQAGLTVNNASKAATDADAGLYIGELSSRGSALSAPIVGAAGVAQLSPADVSVVGKRPPSLLSLSPDTGVQAVDVTLMLGQDDCSRIALTAPTGDGRALRDLIAGDIADRQGMSVVAGAANLHLTPAEIQALEDTTVGPGGFTAIDSVGSDSLTATTALNDYQNAVERVHANCEVVIARNTASLAQVVRGLHVNSSAIKLFVVSTSCSGIGAHLAPSLQCMPPSIPVSDYRGTGSFIKQYQTEILHARRPLDAYDIYGYQAAQLLVDTVKRLGRRAADRGILSRALASDGDRSPVLLSFQFGRNGRQTISFEALSTHQSGRAPNVTARSLTP